MNIKKIILMLAIVCAISSAFAQPNSFSYQAVIRNQSGSLVTNSVGMKFSILSGSTTGAIVYSETHVVTPNQNGLVSLQIGSGTLLSGSIDNIKWGDTSHFLKTEVDISGGINYTIIGVQQLLSVPYALYSIHADSVDNEADPKFMKSVASNIKASDTAKWSANKKTFAGEGISISNDTVSTTDIHYVGEQYGQGIVFYVTDGGRHGLIAALSDIHGLTWCSDCITPTYTGATSALIGSGEGNTLLIMSRAGTDPNLKYAAKVCYNYTVSGNIGGWYLPSKAEAAILYNASSKLGTYAIKSGTWTSTESSSSSTSAWTAGGTTVQKSSTGQPTRPIKKF